ncbi:MAG: hypothetical protein HQ582_17895 [Planctomycetes bacterium]|nr:hypothetical protein [Planctomycetota bacterium]
MTSCKRILRLLMLLLGLVGLVGCTATIVGAWSVRARLSQATENVFAAIDDSVVAVRERVTQTQARVDASKITTEDIAKGLKAWTKRETSERLALRLDVAERAERLGVALQQADHWLEVSESTVELAQKALSMGGATGAPVDTTSLDRLIEEIASVRVQLAEVAEAVARIHERTTGASEEKSPGERIEQAAQLAVRVAATLGLIDSHLKKIENGLSEAQGNLQGLETRALRWILVATVGITLLAVWMATGQAALCPLAWNGLRRTR